MKKQKKIKKKSGAPRRSPVGFFLTIPGVALFAAAIVLAADMYTKYWVNLHIPRANHESQWFPYNGIAVFDNFLGIEFSIVHVTNRGAAWGILTDFQVYLVGLRILFIVGLALFLIFYNKNRLLLIPLTLVVAGAVGNIVDYFLYGHVVDMMKFVFWGYDYPAFNVADASITLGIVSAVIISLRHQKQMLKEA